MPDRNRSYSTLTILTLCLVMTGCASNFKLRLPFAKAKPEPRTLSPLEAESTQVELDAEQKANVQMALAQTMEVQGRTEDAQKLYMEVIKNDPHRVDAFHRLALLHDRKGECQVADQYYAQALTRAPENAELHCDFGYSLYLQEKWPEAEDQLRQAVALQPYLKRAHNNLGMLLARTRREDEALVEFSRAGCSAAEARANLALALTLNDRWEEAQQQYQIALQNNPQLQTARRASSILESVSKKVGAQQVPASAPGGVARASYDAPQQVPGDWRGAPTSVSVR